MQRMRNMLKYALAALALAALVFGAYLQGAADNRVTPQDMAAYTACMAYYHDSARCYQDTIASWQR